MKILCNVLLASLAMVCSLLGAGRLVAAGQDKAQKPPAAQEKQGQSSQQGAAPAQNVREEAQAFEAIQNELDPDRTVQLVNDFAKKFPNSGALALVYLRGAFAYRQKNDVSKVVEYGEKSLKTQAENPVALILVASTLPEPQSFQGSDLDKEKKLTQAAEYGNKALQLIEKMPKQPNMTDEQNQQSKATLSGWAHSSLGLIHLQRASMALTGVDHEELAKAQQEYKSAVSASPRPEASDYYRLGEAYARDEKIDEAIDAFSKASQLGEGTELKKLADEQIERLKKAKSEAKPAAKP